MRALRDAQLAFADRILDPGRTVSPREQLYRNNVFISLTGALADVYPVVKRLVGDAFFAQLARRYIRTHPSRSGNLHDFGRELAVFLGGIPDLKPCPYLPDVAALEWARHAVFHAGEAAPLDAGSLSEDSGISLQPAARLVASRYPILAIWQANQAEEPDTVDLDAGPDWLVVFRYEFQPRILPCTAGEFALLGALADGSTLGEACEAAVAAQPGLDLGAAMGRFVTYGLLAQGV